MRDRVALVAFGVVVMASAVLASPAAAEIDWLWWLWR